MHTEPRLVSGAPECDMPPEVFDLGVTYIYDEVGNLTFVPGSGTATEVGFVASQAGGSYHYSWQKGKLKVLW